MGARVLVVDDDEDMRVLLRSCLETEGFSVDEAPDGETTLRILDRDPIEAIVLDVHIGQPNGLEVCRRIREGMDLPVLLLSGRTSEADELMGLAAGASDYITKPFNPQILCARVAAQLGQRRRGPEAPARAVLRLGDVALDQEARTAWVGDRTVPLTRIEFDLLATLLSRPNKVFTRAELLRQVWTDGWYGDDHLLETHLSRLRRKVREAGGPALASAVRGVGYRLGDPVQRP